ncbi:putative lipoprotein [Leptospira weilii serovar Topaz str. LT2116]|uniref:Putative lipoprotein n=1 Tax=Leptospira weilii serovar Topaz str. LT2116 TaxID=1088540 RepID=M3GZG3_9LEPT|nr:putative lipoprotein [Leptospira weilii serovar Topaz str. LT2116]
MLNKAKTPLIPKILKGFIVIVSASLFTTWVVSCGLKPVPPPEGKFCDVWHKPVECVKLNFRKGIGDLGQGPLPLRMKNVVLYDLEIKDKQNILIEVLHEHRVRITFPGKESRLYLKIKDPEERKRRWEKAREEWEELFK